MAVQKRDLSFPEYPVCVQLMLLPASGRSMAHLFVRSINDALQQWHNTGNIP